MRLETLPVILGVALGLIGLALLADAWLIEEFDVSAERRRRPRRERDRFGEALVGLGVIAMAVAFIARDLWKYRILTVIIGTVLLLWGAKRNAAYLRGVLARRSRTSPVFSHDTADHSRDHHPRAAPGR